MTCIVGMAKDGVVYIGGDSCTSYGSVRMKAKRDKVIKQGEFVFGSTGYTRIPQIVAYQMSYPKMDEGQDEYNYMVTKFVPELRRVIKDAGQLETNNGVEDMYNGLLVGFRGRLFDIGSNFCVDELMEDYFAIGSGMNFALGAMDALKDQDLPPEKFLTKALEAAARWNLYVCEPFVIEKVGDKK